VGGTAVGSVLAASGVSARQGEIYALEQDGSCVGLEPLAADKSVKEFYGYKLGETRYSAEGLADLQRDGASLLFLYRGPDGTTSLVVAHDKRKKEDDKGSGGSVSFQFSGLPDDGEFVVTDDLYNGPHRVDQWSRNGGQATIHWTWIGGRTDGAVFQPVDGATITIQPAFNGDAKLYEEYYEGDVEQWLAVSGPLDDPEYTELSMDQPVTVRTGGC
jgi:hypothetical protein